MAYIKEPPKVPESWRKYRAKIRYRASLPFFYVEWLAEWCTFLLSRWSFLEVLESCGSLSILVGVIFYFAGAHDRLEQKHYQAWQVINTAQGKGGSGGRIDAMEELNADGVPLVGIDVRDAFLQNVELPGAELRRADMRSTDMRGVIFREAKLEDAVLIFANLRGGDLSRARLVNADLTNADLQSVNLSGADVSGTLFDAVDLRHANFENLVNWQSIGSMKQANIQDARNAPPGFVEWAKAHGAVDVQAGDPWTPPAGK